MPFMDPAFNSLRAKIEAEIQDALFGAVDEAEADGDRFEAILRQRC
jgi:hypothetical protein